MQPITLLMLYISTPFYILQRYTLPTIQVSILQKYTLPTIQVSILQKYTYLPSRCPLCRNIPHLPSRCPFCRSAQQKYSITFQLNKLYTMQPTSSVGRQRKISPFDLLLSSFVVSFCSYLQAWSLCKELISNINERADR